MTDQVCPFCEAKNEDGYWYECLTVRETSELDGLPVYGRAPQCYERQISQLKAGIGEALEMVEEVAKELTCSDDQGQWCVFCQFWHDDYLDKGIQEHKPECLMYKAQVLIPKLRALKVEK